ncbi:MAG: 3-hydroxylacyl-ACP dehydratase [Methylococcales bacterium]|nr:3-hydroxylacyl-ACP dehydratase [Methylococcales bacterium]
MIDINVADILPHAGQMMLLDKVLEYDQQRMVVETKVCNDGLFGDEKTVPAWLGIEYMAQAVAAHGGMIRYLAGKPINIGFLLGTRRYNSNTSTFNVGVVLTVTVERLIEDQGLSAFDCQIIGKGVDVSAKLNVYQPNEIDNRIFS